MQDGFWCPYTYPPILPGTHPAPPPVRPSPLPALQEFLGEPNGPLSHELLHTTYTDRSHTSLPAYSAFERLEEGAHPHPRLAQQAHATAAHRSSGSGCGCTGGCSCH